MNQIQELLNRAIREKEEIGKEKEGKEIYHIAYSGTSNYLVHTGIAMTSVIESNPDMDFHFHLFINGIEPEDKEKMEQLVRKTGCALTLYYVDDDVFRGMLHRDGIAGFFYRFVIPRTVAGDGVQKILYMDGDVMCRGSLRPFFEEKLGDNIAACIEDTSPAFAAGRKKSLGTKEYFNSGVMMINVDQWNQENVSEKAAEMAIERKQSGAPLRSHDQDILNLLLDGRFVMMGRKYNAIYNMDMKGFFQKQEPLVYDSEAVLVHFAGIVKPWRTWVQDLPAVKEYLAFRKDSPWRDVPLVGFQRHKDIHQAARHARRMKKYGESLGLYMKYFAGKLSGRN